MEQKKRAFKFKQAECTYVAKCSPAKFEAWLCKNCDACMHCGSETVEGKCIDETCTARRASDEGKARMDFAGPETYPDGPKKGEPWPIAERPYGVLQKLHKGSLLRVLRNTWKLITWEDIEWIMSQEDTGPRVLLRRVEFFSVSAA